MTDLEVIRARNNLRGRNRSDGTVCDGCAACDCCARAIRHAEEEHQSEGGWKWRDGDEGVVAA